MASYPNGIPVPVKRRRYTLRIGIGFFGREQRVDRTFGEQGNWGVILLHPLADSPEEAFYLAKQEVIKRYKHYVDPNAIWLYADRTNYQEVK